MSIFNNSDFYKTLYEDHAIYDIYKITQCLDKKISPNPDIISNYDWNVFNIFSFELFPSYFKYNLAIKNNFILRKTEQKPGFSIDLKNYTSINDYIDIECSKQHKKNINRATSRLENSFNITYKTFYGSIAKDEYEFIMNSLESMIAKRFQQREGRNKTLANWGEHFEKTIHLINEKKASLFIIYDEDKPIEVSINYHIDTIMYSSISSYDLDYGKFSLGNIEIYKQLEWCILNNIFFFDMGYGDFDYKRKWSNYIYNFEDHIIFHKYNLLGTSYAFFKKCKYQIINYLISKKINDKIYNVLEKFKKTETTISNSEYELIPLTSLPNEINNLENIKLNNNAYHFLRQPVYDYLYKNNEHIKNIKVYKFENEPNTFLISGTKNQIKIKITK